MGKDARRLAGAVVIASASLLAGCQPAESPGASGAATPAPSAYDAEERAIQRQALRRLDAFEARNQRFLSAGEATRQAKSFYQDRLREWRPSFALLRRHERERIKVARRPVVLSTRVISVKSFQDNAAEVVLERCTDQSDLGVTRDGVPVPAVHDEPVLQEVVVHRYENRTWLIGTVETAGRPCVG